MVPRPQCPKGDIGVSRPGRPPAHGNGGTLKPTEVEWLKQDVRPCRSEALLIKLGLGRRGVARL